MKHLMEVIIAARFEGIDKEDLFEDDRIGVDYGTFSILWNVAEVMEEWLSETYAPYEIANDAGAECYLFIKEMPRLGDGPRLWFLCGSIEGLSEQLREPALPFDTPVLRVSEGDPTRDLVTLARDMVAHLRECYGVSEYWLDKFSPDLPDVFI